VYKETFESREKKKMEIFYKK